MLQWYILSDAISTITGASVHIHSLVFLSSQLYIFKEKCPNHTLTQVPSCFFLCLDHLHLGQQGEHLTDHLRLLVFTKNVLGSSHHSEVLN